MLPYGAKGDETPLFDGQQGSTIAQIQGRPRRPETAQPPNGLLAFFSRFAARFSIKLLAGFFLLSFLVSLLLLIADRSGFRLRTTILKLLQASHKTGRRER